MRSLKSILAAVLCALASVAASAQGSSFPYPDVPQVMTKSDDRLVYLLEHFWERYDFTDATSDNEQVGEQGFADFISLMPRAGEQTQLRAVEKLVKRLRHNQNAVMHFSSLMEHYLGNPDSPLRNDIVYARLLRGMLTLRELDDASKSILTYRLKMTEKNQVGTHAADFDYIDRVGSNHRLYDVHSKLTLVVFNDPECEHCHQLMPKIVASKVIANDPRLTLLSIYPDDNVNAWVTMSVPLPHRWHEGRSPAGQIMRDQVYDLKALPSLYLLAADKTVLLKDATLQEVEAWLQANL